MTRPFLVAIALGLLVTAPADAQQQTAPPSPLEEGVDLQVYRADGSPASLDEILRAADSAEVVLVGEEHDDGIGHRVEAALLHGALLRYAPEGPQGPRKVVLSLEMFERDVQYVVDEYLAGWITEEHFLDSTRPWDEYRTAYRPLVELAKEWRAPVVAANAPRRYVNRVTREGPASLGDLGEQARSYLPPLPYPGPSDAYRAQWDSIMSEAMAEAEQEDSTVAAAHHAIADSSSAPGSYTMNPNAIWAQALWDASMGHAIATALMRYAQDRPLVLHFVGSFHVERGTGIPERLRDYRPGTRTLTVVMTKVDDPGEWDRGRFGALGDFVVLTRRPKSPHGP